MTTSEKPVAIVTGASAGIGKAAAIQLAAKGYFVYLAARRIERLREIVGEIEKSGFSAAGVQVDVADAAQVEGLVDRSVSERGRLDVMINNAGYGLFARLTETADDQMKRMMDVNYMGVFYGSKAAAKVMMKQRRGHIFNVSSVIGKRGTPFHSAYCATKFAIAGLTESLRVEMLPYDVRVTLVCPALTETEFFDQSGGPAAKSSFERFKKLMPAEGVARGMVKAVGRRKPEIVFSLGGKFLTHIATLCPGLTDRMMKYYHDDLAKKLMSEK